MSYRLSVMLGAASMALAHGTPKYGHGPEVPSGSSLKLPTPPSDTSAPFPTLTPASGTGILPTGVFPTGAPYSGVTAMPSDLPSGYSTMLPPTEPSPSGPSPICLQPIVPSDHDTQNPENLNPKYQHTLHYQGGGSSGNSDTHATLDYEFHHPSIPLEHIDSVKDVQCPSDNQISFSFGSVDMFDKAVNAWPKSGKPFILIDATEGCGKSQQRTFFKVKDYTVDKKSTSVKANGEMLSGGDPSIVKGFNAKWEHNASPGGLSARQPKPTSVPNLAKRIFGWSPESAFHSEVTKASSKIGGVETAVETKAGEIKTAAETKASAAVSDVEDLSTKVMSKDVSYSLDVQPTGTASSPFGPAKSLGSLDGVTIYCIECGAHGGLHAEGEMTVGLTSPIIKSGSIDVSATGLKIPMVFGFQAENAKAPNLPLKSQIFSDGLAPFDIPDVFSIGPMLTVDVSFNLQVSASGRLVAGVNYAWDNAQAHLDLANKDPGASHETGWQPTIHKTFNMSAGQLDVNGTFGVPISLAFGVNILNGKFDQNISITDTPNIELDTIVNTPGSSPQKRYEDRNHARDLLIRQEDQCSNGVQEIIKFGDAVNFNVFDLWATQLATFSTQVFSTCIATGSSSGAPGGPTSGVAGPSGSAPANPTPSSGTAPVLTSSSGASAPTSAPTAPATTSASAQ